MALPANFQTVTVTGTYIDLLGNPLAGKVTFTIKQPLVDPSIPVTIAAAPIQATLDANGTFTVDLPATNDPDILPSGFTYTVNEDFGPSLKRSYEIQVPFDTVGSIDLSTVSPVTPVGAVTPSVVSVNGKTGVVVLALGVVPPFSVSGQVAVATGAHRWYNDHGAPLEIRSVRANVGTAPAGSSLTVDVLKSGVSIFTTQPSIPAGSNTSGAVIPTTTALADGEYLTVSVTQVGSTMPGSDLTVQILAY